jgi:hypothetical protein
MYLDHYSDKRCGSALTLKDSYLIQVEARSDYIELARRVVRVQTAISCRLCFKCDGTRAEISFRLSAKRTSPFKSARVVSLVDYWQPSCAHQRDTPCSEVVWRVLATHSIRQFPLHFPSRASPCAITFQLDSTLNRLPICVVYVVPIY